MGNKLILPENNIVRSYFEGSSCENIAVEYKCHWTTIRNLLLRNKVLLRGYSDAVRSKRRTLITDEHRQIIEGLLLGDGSVFRRSRTACLRLKSVQKEFVEKIQKILPFAFNYYTEEACVRNIVGKDCACQEAHIIESPVDLSLNDYRDKWYPHGKKIVPEYLELTPLICKYWFYGDGYSSYIGNNCVIVGLCTNSFTKQECAFLQNKLKVIGFDFKLAKKKKGYVIAGRKKDSVNGFFKYIGDSELECFRYKWKEHKGTRPCRGY